MADACMALLLVFLGCHGVRRAGCTRLWEQHGASTMPFVQACTALAAAAHKRLQAALSIQPAPASPPLRRAEDGDVCQSTCCNNTATENLMCERLIIDDITHWAKSYKVDGFRYVWCVWCV